MIIPSTSDVVARYLTDTTCVCVPIYVCSSSRAS